VSEDADDIDPENDDECVGLMYHPPLDVSSVFMDSQRGVMD
jgi:hypothetical protein